MKNNMFNNLIITVLSIFLLGQHVSSQLTAPFLESFNSTTTPTGWTQKRTSGSAWVIHRQSFGPGLAASSILDHTDSVGGEFAWMDFAGTDVGVILESDSIDISSLTTPELSFWYNSDTSGFTLPALNLLYIEAYNGTTWVGVDTLQQDNSGVWSEHFYDMTSYVFGGNKLLVRFRAESGGSSLDFYHNFLIDDISINEFSTCRRPLLLNATNFTATSGTAKWNPGSFTGSTWQVQHGTQGFSLGSGTFSTTLTVDSLVISGLSANTRYDFYVRKYCSPSDTSVWSGPFTFKTTCNSSLSGNYTIDQTLPSAGTNFNSFTDAVQRLKDCGIGSSVVFDVKQGTYTEQISIGEINGTSAANTITFKNDPTNTALPVIEFANTIGNNYVLELANDAEYLIFDSLTISSRGSTYSKVISIPQSVNNIVIKNCELNGFQGAIFNDNQALIFQRGGSAKYCTIENNRLNGGSTGIYFEGPSPSAKDVGNSFIGNTLRNVNFNQVYFFLQDSLLLDKNDMIQKPTSAASSYGIYASACDNIEITANTVVLNTSTSNYGLYLGNINGTSNEVINNMIVTSANSPSGFVFGLWVFLGSNLNIYHNSINLRSGATTRALNVEGSTSTTAGNNNIVNNIFVNSSGAGYALYTTSAGSTSPYITSMDYNMFFANGLSPFNFNRVDYSSLSSFQLVSTTDANSYFANPGFVSSSDLHLVGFPAADSGLNVGVLVDIDGDPRPLAPSTGFDVGADEYIPPSCPSPSVISAPFLVADSVTLTWTNGPFDSSWIVEYGPAGFTPGSGITINSGNDTLSINGLSQLTCYDVYVKSICTVGDTSFVIGPYNFCTPCGSNTPPYFQDFSTGMTRTTVPTCWREARGLLTTNSSIAYGTSTWDVDGFANNGTTGSAKVEVAFTGRFDWLVSPSIDLGTGTTPYQVEFDIALTDRSNPGRPFGDSIGPDDKISLIISTDDGSTWSDTNVLRQWDSLDIPSHLGDYFSFDLTAAGYTGKVRLAVYIESSVSNTTTELFIDNFNVVPVPSCPSPTLLRLDSTTSTTAVMNWVNGSSDVSWLLEYGQVGFVAGTGTIVSSSTNPGTITGLNASSCYDVYLRSICSPGDTSRLIGPQRICTECLPVVDLCEDFEAAEVNQIPHCWESLVATTFTGTPSSLPYIRVNNTSGNRAPNSVRMDAGFAAGPATALILSSPEMTALPLGTHRASFWLRRGFVATSQLVVGTITDPSNPSTFTPVDTIIGLTSSYSKYSVSFENYTGTDTRVAFLHVPLNNFERIDLDDFCFEVIPSCEIPPTVNILNSTQDSTSINLGWAQDTTYFIDPLKYQKEFIITYGPAGFMPGDPSVIDTLYTSTTVAPAPTNNFFQITGLVPLTEYCFWVKAICDNGDTSMWSGPHCGSTGCPTAVALPYSEDFTDYTSAFPLDETPLCWEEGTGSIGGSVALMTESNWEPDGFANVNTTGAARFNIPAFGVREGWLITPTFNLGNDPNIARIIEFDIALTDDFSSNPAINGFGDDDTIALVVSYDEGVTWNRSDILMQWDTSNEPSNTGDAMLHILRNTTGKVKFGFYGVSNVGNEGVDFFVDNFSIRDTTWVSVEENTIDVEKFAVYPNPNTGIFTVQNKGKANTSNVKLMDMQGRLVYDNQITFAKNGTQQIQVENLKSGVYVLLLQGKGKLEQHRIVIQ